MYVPIWEEDRRKLDSRRLAAVIIDGIVLLPLLIPLSMLFGELNSGAWLVYVACELGYFHLCESTSGQTIGKRLMDLRVVRAADAGPASAAAISGRTVLRLVDGLPGVPLVGLLSMILTGKRRRRLGDLAAGTVVTRASARPFTPARHTTLQTLYPTAWLGAAIAVVLLAGHSGDAGLAQIDSLCKDAETLQAKLGPNPAPERYYAIRAQLVQQVLGMRPTTRRMRDAGDALIRYTAEEIELARAGSYAAAAALARSHHQELADLGLKHC